MESTARSNIVRGLAGAITLTAAAACSAGTGNAGTVAAAPAACARGLHHTEVQDTGTVTRILGVLHGPSGAHEGFIVQFGSNSTRIEDNIDITGYIPLQRGDRITLRGQYECNDGVIHWTHRDLRGRHESGFIEVNGKRYQ